jgi:hypothetical protein
VSEGPELGHELHEIRSLEFFVVNLSDFACECAKIKFINFTFLLLLLLLLSEFFCPFGGFGCNTNNNNKKFVILVANSKVISEVMK